MKLMTLPLNLVIVLCLSACSLNSPAYLGSKYNSTKLVQSFYSTQDIKLEETVNPGFETIDEL
ncbi:hypothetical protein SAMN05443550_1016 [Pedobacter hartonius]|uniref:Uncharacterized protein n=1 Tax=Pedobacter hartonius TaxID=425514 RepID=A0A1H3VXU9_9SPHI|nr:hypothetical protein SAMN05443550_1016 [Pedobacter hartonius]